MRRARASEDEVDRLDGQDRVAVERVEIEHENVGRLADAERARPRRAIGEAAVGDDRLKPTPAFDPAFEAPAAMEEMAEPHFAQNVVVLVECGRVDAERDAAAAPHRFGNRRDAAAQVQI